jgi:hypothetical protein
MNSVVQCFKRVNELKDVLRHHNYDRNTHGTTNDLQVNDLNVAMT